MRQLIQEPTRVTTTTRTLIDLMFSNLDHISYARPVNLKLSDHFPTVLCQKKDREEKRPFEIEYRSYSKLDYELFASKFKELHLTFVYSEEDPNLLWDRMFSTIIKVLDELCPYRLIRISDSRPDRVYY